MGHFYTLRWLCDRTVAYKIDSGFIRILAAEYRALFLTGRFSDALQVPDNLMEFAGAKFQSPFRVDDSELLLQLHRLLPPNQYWSTAINRALAKHELREETVAIDRAMVLRLEAVNQKLNALATGMDVMAKYQFHAILAAMRNGRSHFRCRPLDHDLGLEFSATWVWSFFLIGLRLIARGEPPISPGPNVGIDVIKEAVLGRWLPSSSLESILKEGDGYCRIILLTFGHLLRVGLLQFPSELRIEADHAL